MVSDESYTQRKGPRRIAGALRSRLRPLGAQSPESISSLAEAVGRAQRVEPADAVIDARPSAITEEREWRMLVGDVVDDEADFQAFQLVLEPVGGADIEVEDVVGGGDRGDIRVRILIDGGPEQRLLLEPEHLVDPADLQERGPVAEQPRAAVVQLPFRITQLAFDRVDVVGGAQLEHPLLEVGADQAVLERAPAADVEHVVHLEIPARA